MKEMVQKADGKLGILIPGLGAVATTLIAGVDMAALDGVMRDDVCLLIGVVE